jgi:hypothetical protein
MKNKLIHLNFKLSSEFFFYLYFSNMFSDVINVDSFQVQVDGRLLEIVDDDWRKVPYKVITQSLNTGLYMIIFSKLKGQVNMEIPSQNYLKFGGNHVKRSFILIPFESIDLTFKKLTWYTQHSLGILCNI